MALGKIFWSIKDTGKKVLVQNSLFGFLSYYLGIILLSMLLTRTENGYVKDFKDVDIRMAHPIYFSEFLTEKPLKGYIAEADIDEGDTVVDAGAFPGEFSIYAASKGAEVIAFEPDPKNAEKLRKNIKMNGLEESVEIVEKGLWKKSGEKELKRDKLFGLGSRIGKGEMKIELVDLDQFIDREIDLVKMDVEGAEIEALKGCKKLMEEKNPEFAIATYHEDREGRKTCHRIEEIFEAHGYKAKTGYPRHLTTYGRVKDD